MFKIIDNFGNTIDGPFATKEDAEDYSLELCMSKERFREENDEQYNEAIHERTPFGVVPLTKCEEELLYKKMIGETLELSVDGIKVEVVVKSDEPLSNGQIADLAKSFEAKLCEAMN